MLCITETSDMPKKKSKQHKNRFLKSSKSVYIGAHLLIDQRDQIDQREKDFTSKM